MFSFPVFGNMKDDTGLLQCVAYLPTSCGNIKDTKFLQQTMQKDSENKFLAFSVKVQCKERKVYPFNHVIPFSKNYKRYGMEIYITDKNPTPNFICFFESVAVARHINKLDLQMHMLGHSMGVSHQASPIRAPDKNENSKNLTTKQKLQTHMLGHGMGVSHQASPIRAPDKNENSKNLTTKQKLQTYMLGHGMGVSHQASPIRAPDKNENSKSSTQK